MQSYAVVMIDSVTNVGEYLSFCKNLKTTKVGQQVRSTTHKWENISFSISSDTNITNFVSESEEYITFVIYT